MDSVLLQSTYQQAIADYQAGNYSRAMQLFQTILHESPQHAESLHMLGLLALQVGNFSMATQLIAESLSVNPDNAEALCNLANALRGEGKLTQAEIALHGSLALNDQQSRAWSNLSDLMISLGKIEESVAAGKRAISLDATSADAYCNLGSAYIHQNKYCEAIESLTKGLETAPNNALLQVNLGLAYNKIKDWQKSAACYEKALSIAPTFIDAYNNYAIMEREQGDFIKAKSLLENALSIDSEHYRSKYHYADILFELGDFAGCINHYQAAINLGAETQEAHFGLAFALLMTGDYAEGWRQYMWRDLKQIIGLYQQSHPNVPMWQGESLSDKTIVVICEQGYGDSIQFIRYIDELSSLGAKHIVLSAPEPLKKLFSSIIDTELIFTHYDALPAHDYFSPLLNLPAILGTDLQSIPNKIPYLKTISELQEKWRCRFADSGRPRIGVVWHGSNKNVTDYKRSIEFSYLMPLLEMQEFDWYSLQVDNAEKDFASQNIIDLSMELTDFAETAAAIEQLDLIITVCTSTAHLAGALGKPTWIMLAHVPDWRWMWERAGSPWYPSARLFRQSTRGDWQGVVRQVKSALPEIYTPP